MSATNDIDQEWEHFISNDYANDDTSSDEEEYAQLDKYIKKNAEEFVSANLTMDLNVVAPKATNIYISTKTKMAYLNKPIDTTTLFWSVPVIPYSKPVNGVIKKQIKLDSDTKEKLAMIQDRIKDEPYYEERVMTHIDNPAGRIKFKDIRKISIGISKKDILTYRCKKRQAFFNCFVIILRIKIDDIFKEFHVKVFNTGKLEIPGIQNDTTFQLILKEIIATLQPHIDGVLDYKPDTEETILINSNFNCGFFINRDKLFEILTKKYKIHAIYDPCPYPGIQCKFFYNPELGVQDGCQISEETKHLYKNVKKISFMIFRTGSVLIVGKCDESVLMEVYEFIKVIVNNEYHNICHHLSPDDEEAIALKNKPKKTRRKNVMAEFTNVPAEV